MPDDPLPSRLEPCGGGGRCCATHKAPQVFLREGFGGLEPRPFPHVNAMEGGQIYRRKPKAKAKQRVRDGARAGFQHVGDVRLNTCETVRA
jgi:hypothetical protein